MGKMKELGLLDCEDRQSIEENFERMKKSSGGDLLETVETEVPLEITFDGDLTGKETASSGENGYYVKISDIIISNIEDVIGSKIVLSISGVDNSMVVTAENVMDVSEYGMPAYIVTDNDGNAACLFVKEDFAMGEEAMSSGIWFNRIDVDGTVRYPKSLTCPNATTTTTKQQLKPSLLPPHKHKWDDIEDAICYDRSKSEPLNITFDGDLTGKEFAGGFVKVSNAIISAEMLLGSIVIATDSSGQPVLEIEGTAENIMDGTSQGTPAVYLAHEGTPLVMCVHDEISEADGEFTLTAGVWFMHMGEDGYIKSLTNPNATVTTSELKKIDNKFIDAEWMAKDNILTELTFDGNATGLESYDDGSMVKISSEIFTVEELTGCVVSVVSADVGNFSYEGVVEYLPSFERIDVDNELGGFVTIQLENNSRGVSPGVYVFCGAAGNYVSSIKFAKPIVKANLLPPKFIPELTQVILKSTTEGSKKKFRVTVDDTGALTAVEV